jgi:hypothetical protein
MDGVLGMLFLDLGVVVVGFLGAGFLEVGFLGFSSVLAHLNPHALQSLKICKSFL